MSVTLVFIRVCVCLEIDELYDIFIRIYSRCLQIELQSYLLNIKLTKQLKASNCYIAI